MIEKMRFVTISGPKEDIDRVIDLYLSKYELQLENSLSELQSIQDLRPFHEVNPYRDFLAKAEILKNSLQFHSERREIKIQESKELTIEAYQKFIDYQDQIQRLSNQIKDLQSEFEHLLPFEHLDYDLEKFSYFDHLKYHFGRFRKEDFKKFEQSIYQNSNSIFLKCHESDRYIYGIYFAPDRFFTKVDAMYSSANFEHLDFPDDYLGTPADKLKKLKKSLSDTKEALQREQTTLQYYLEENKVDIFSSYDLLKKYTQNFEIRKFAALTQENSQGFYILCGWISQKDAQSLSAEIEQDYLVYCFVKDEYQNSTSLPPTKLKNPSIFRPFELFIRMYGVPAYHETDPTIGVALLYAFFFGLMFGDVGQGLCLVIGGFSLYFTKKIALCAIIGLAGIFSIIFGFLFGSVFGFENIIKPLWLHPNSAMTNLPFIGKLNTVFIVTILIGMLVIFCTMIMHIINALAKHDLESALFDANGVAGLIFYGLIILMLVLFFSGKTLPPKAILGLLFLIPLLLIFFKEPLAALLEKKKDIFPKQKGMFFVQSLFELFEVLLGYFSNTLSFVRIGAFAVSHAAMMGVVMMLSGAEHGSPNWIIVIVGNLIVMLMEGLIVGIQVLRLVYYEIFSRFYQGSGKEFQGYTQIHS
ncbi:V-type ATP synthase subunit I [Clostridia bacterium]|nr:V-type ATP synthase subunit I [Clostridia bacterium]